MRRQLIAAFSLLLAASGVKAQDSSLLNMLDDSAKNVSNVSAVTATFKATHIINMESIETPAKGVLQFLIQHRFGKINDGGYQLWGLDNATLRLGFDYGITDRLSVGVGRSSNDKIYDASIKYKLVQQTTDDRVPISIDLFGDLAYTTLKYTDKPYLNAKYRTSYVTQVLIARKLSNHLSLELTPSWIHFNLVPTVQDKNDMFATSVGGRLKLGKRTSINAEYNYLFPNQINSTTAHNSLSGGFDIETGGHVFQLVFSNSQDMAAPYYLARTTGSWGKGDIYFGFNISRNFTVRKHTKIKNDY